MCLRVGLIVRDIGSCTEISILCLRGINTFFDHGRLTLRGQLSLFSSFVQGL